MATALLLPVATPDTGVSAAPATQASTPQAPAKVNNTLRALDRLRQMGYTWTTDAGALKAIKHWQRVNGLVVDGDVGPQTLASLGLSGANVNAPAVRVNPPAPQPSCDTECIIREVWPDDLEDKAVRTAKRESGPNLLVTAHNACCYGNFQIYFQAHRAMLADFGVHQPSDLYDPRVNATVAYALYQQVGWQPWNGGA
jgi:hypothetical protein